MFKANLHALLSLLCINFQKEKNFIICLARCERASCTIQSNSDSVFQKQPGGQPATTPSRLHRHLPSVPARPGTSQGFHASATSPSAHSSSLAGRRQGTLPPPSPSLPSRVVRLSGHPNRGARAHRRSFHSPSSGGRIYRRFVAVFGAHLLVIRHRHACCAYPRPPIARRRCVSQSRLRGFEPLIPPPPPPLAF
jgi:hypothetical protein